MNPVRIAAAAVVAAASLALFAPAAHAVVDWGPPTQAPVVASCSLVTVDPPTPINVYLHGFIDNAPVELTVEAAQVNGHEAEFDISGFTGAATDPVSYDLWATWDLGTGNSAHAVGLVGPCAEAPTSTTTSTTVPPTTSTTTTTVVPAHQCKAANGSTYGYDGPEPPCGLATTTTTTRPPVIGTSITATRKELPFTGGTPWGLVALGVALAVAGVCMLGTSKAIRKP